MTKPTKKEYESFVNETWSIKECKEVGIEIPEDTKNIGTYLRRNDKELFEIGYSDYVTTAK